MIKGIVKWFNEDKGFGFIQSSGKDYFVHYKEIKQEGFKSLKEGSAVKFTPESSPKGPMATQVYLGVD